MALLGFGGFRDSGVWEGCRGFRRYRGLGFEGLGQTFQRGLGVQGFWGFRGLGF